MNILKAQLRGDLRNGDVGKAQQVFCSGDTQLLMILDGRGVMGFAENMHQVGFADMEGGRQLVQCDRPVDVMFKIDQDLGQASSADIQSVRLEGKLQNEVIEEAQKEGLHIQLGDVVVRGFARGNDIDQHQLDHAGVLQTDKGRERRDKAVQNIAPEITHGGGGNIFQRIIGDRDFLRVGIVLQIKVDMRLYQFLAGEGRDAVRLLGANNKQVARLGNIGVILDDDGCLSTLDVYQFIIKNDPSMDRTIWLHCMIPHTSDIGVDVLIH